MVVDKDLQFNTHGTPQAITATAASNNELDWQNTDPKLGEGPGVEAVFVVTTTFAHVDSSATLTIAVQDSADGGTYATIAQSKAIARDDLVDGAKFRVAVPRSHRRWLQTYYTVAGSGNFTAGALHAFLSAKQ